MANAPSVAEYVRVLGGLDHRVTEEHRRLFRVHYNAPDRTATPTQLATWAEIPGGWTTVNARYGKLGHTFCDELGIKPDLRPDFTHRWWSVWSRGWSTPDGFVWQMLPQVAEALEQLGWLTPEVALTQLAEPSNTADAFEADDLVQGSKFDWQAEVREWCHSHRELPPEWEPSVIELFRRAFEKTYLPQHAWFGTHQSAVSLVVGGIFLAAIYRKRQEWVVSLLADQEPPAIEGVKYEPVKSTNGSPHPLLWADTTSLQALQSLLANHGFWDSFASASHKIHSSPRIANDRDVVQGRRQKRRLSEFWNVRGQALGAEEADQRDLSNGEGYRPESGDRRRLIERQIRERRGQHQFRDALRERYGDRCLVTGCEVLAVLEAAHINPYRGDDDNHPENGLLLRSDVHTLFDLDLLGIEPEQLRVELHPDLTKEYGHLVGVALGCPSDHWPSREALRLRYEQFRQRLCGTW